MRLSERIDKWYCKMFHSKWGNTKDTHWQCKTCNLYFNKLMSDNDTGPL